MMSRAPLAVQSQTPPGPDVGRVGVTGSVPILDEIHLPLADRRDGKVRSSWALPPDEIGPRRVFVTSDRLSAFDRVVGFVPAKGQLLNQLAAWWFGQTEDIVANHLILVPDPAVLVARAATPLPVEVIVRRAITGVTNTSLWKRYESGARLIDGHRLPDGLRKNDLLPDLIITPTTKGANGAHDEPLSVAGVVEQGLVDPVVWAHVCSVALELFARGEALAHAGGLVLADTKYEFGVAVDGSVMLIDEVHTPDSSRFWEAGTYQARVAAGQEPVNLDKEVIRLAFAALEYRGEGVVPTLPPHVWNEVLEGYVRTYESLTGQRFEPAVEQPATRIPAALERAGFMNGRT